MPYTLSHAAAVLPFSRLLARWQLLSAAIIGAMVPDFRVFLPWRFGHVETHSAMALLIFCLPVGVITYWLFQGLVKTPVLEVLPEGPYARWRPFAAPAHIGSARQWVLAACGVLGGAVTHLVWDAFTHEGARGVRWFPLLDDPMIEMGRRHVDGVAVMQDLSSLIGLVAVLALVAYGLRRGREPAVPNRLVPRTERRQWLLAYVLAVVALSCAFYVRARWAQPPLHSTFAQISTMAVAALRGLAAALLGVSLALDLRLRALRYRSSGPDR
ncbi:MAG TPA: DUF4184 family protein [Steroidobacteraceae bacterium]|jgi:hypothetical protein|nr:DUF4184 family protein [Steroidobacteraceae bacterium]